MNEELELEKLNDLAIHYPVYLIDAAAEHFTLDWNRKTLTVTAYAETKEQSRIINSYMENSDTKYKRVIHKV